MIEGSWTIKINQLSTCDQISML